MKKLLFLVCMFSPFLMKAQVDTTFRGVKFEHGLSWTAIQAKAKAENKYIFLDCFATWCAPCKKMDESVYPLQEAGNYYNERFISVKVQMNQTAYDDPNVKSWYGDATTIQADYSVSAFPTFLFFSPDLKPLHKVAGGLNIKDFVNLGKDALDPKKQYYTILENFKPGKMSTSELKGLARAFKFSGIGLADKIAGDYLIRIPRKDLAMKDNLVFMQEFSNNPLVVEIAVNYINRLSKPEIEMKDNLKFITFFSGNKKVIKISTQYINSLNSKDLYKKENITLIASITNHSKDRGFNFFYYKAAKVDGLMRIKGYAQKITDNVITKEEIDPILIGDAERKLVPNWNKISKSIQKKYTAACANRNILNSKVIYYYDKRNWQEYIKYAIQQVERYPADTTSILGEGNINNLAWDIFLHSNDKKQIETAIKWMKFVLRRGICLPTSTPLDTYANLLYKYGKIDSAIKLEEKVCQLQPTDKSFDENIKKMKRGEQTWPSN